MPSICGCAISYGPCASMPQVQGLTDTRAPDRRELRRAHRLTRPFRTRLHHAEPARRACSKHVEPLRPSTQPLRGCSSLASPTRFARRSLKLASLRREWEFQRSPTRQSGQRLSRVRGGFSTSRARRARLALQIGGNPLAKRRRDTWPNAEPVGKARYSLMQQHSQPTHLAQPA